ncbi:ABC transporter ATP-binding protein [Chloroflexota bacterium]
MSNILILSNVEVMYAGCILVLAGISMELGEGKITTLLGPNGSGKSTALKAISGLLRTEEGRVTAGTIMFKGKHLENGSPDETSRLGIIQVLQGRRVFEHLTVEENLKIAGNIHGKNIMKRQLDWVYDLFPRLKDLRRKMSGYLSGGEQQMLVIGRGLMSLPKVMLLDEPSLGLAPRIIDEVHDTIKKINEEDKITFLLVEQNAWAALSIADYAYVIDNGRVVLDGPSYKVRDNKDVLEFHLGISETGERQSYWDVKHYKRRKRYLG